MTPEKRRRNPRGEMPFLEHLEELRWRILWALLAVVVGTVVGFVLVQYFDVMEILVSPIRKHLEGGGGRLHYFSPVDPFFITLKLAVLVGVILAAPVVIYQVWAFLSPALEKEEKRVIVPALYLGLVLFAAGVLTAYFLALPVTLEFLMGFQKDFLQETIEVNHHLAFVTKLLIAFGVVFELPVVVMILTALGIVTPEFLRQKRRHAIVAITVLASFLSPGDVITVTILLMVPLFLLYELSIILSRMIHRRRQERRLEGEREAREARPAEGSVEAGR